MDSGYRELYFVFGTMAFVLICSTVGLILFVKYLRRDAQKKEQERQRK
jgi:hypothetical protein